MTDCEARMSQNAEHPMERYGDGLRNIANDPDYLARHEAVLKQFGERIARHHEERRVCLKVSAITKIRAQPFFG